MADGKRTYQIVINGLTESVDAVKSLNSQLNELENRIKDLENKAIKITSTGGASTSSNSSLSEEEKLMKQINQLEEKRELHSQKIYQNYLEAKDVLREVDKEQKSIAATERLQEKTYANTMQGMKQELADIKASMQTVDLGDSDKMKQMVDRANELNEKLKEIEKSYGQFGRNVGNYASAAEGFSKFTVKVGDVTREFNTAKEAARTLSNELLNLPKGAEGADELRSALQKVKSEIQDIGKSSTAMDDLLDTMQSITAIASVGQGFRALFGIDDSEIQKSIQKLVALQNVLKGIETINKQINTGEGIGKWIAPFNTQIDKATAKLLAFNKSMLGTNTASKVAATGINLFSKALKAITSIGIMLAINLLIEGFGKLIDSLKKVDKEAERAKEIQEEVNKSYAEATAKITSYTAKVKNFNGTKKQEKKLVEELNREFGNTLGTYSSLAQWMDVLIKKGGDYVKMLTLQAKAQAAFNNLVETQQAKMKFDNSDFEDYERWYDDFLEPFNFSNKSLARKREQEIGKQIKEDLSVAEKGVEDANKELQDFMESHKIGDYAPQIEKGGKKTGEAIKKADDELIQLRIANMKEGLNKTIKQLEEERKQRLAKLESNDKYYEEKKAEINEFYDNKILEAKKEWAEDVEKTYRNMWNNIYSYSLESVSKIAELENIINEINTDSREKDKSINYINNSIPSSYGVQGVSQLSQQTIEDLKLEEDLNKNLSEIYFRRIGILRMYWSDRIRLEEESTDAIYQSQVELENERFEKEKRDNAEHSNDLATQLEKWREKELSNTEITEKKKKEIEDKYWEIYLRNLDEFINRQQVIEDLHNKKLVKLERDRDNNLLKVNSEYFQEELQELRDFQTAISNLENKQPVFNSWGIINLKETAKNNAKLLSAYKTLSFNIIEIKESLQRELKERRITFEDFQNANRELDAFAENVGEKMDKVRSELSLGGQIGSFIQSINGYLQEGLSAIQTVLDAFADYQDYEFDMQQEALDRENEMLDKKLDEQERIVEEHKDNIQSIEDELATSRGDRRQHLIDQLNKEIEAQRAAAAEEKKIKKQQEDLEEKQEKLDKKRKEAEWRRNLNQILISTAMATANGLATQPFIPTGIAMGALATSLGMVQYALAASKKPYAKGGQLDGGVAVGNRHRDGGIKVLGGRAEIEGGEFITNRITTQMNVPLLEFINSKRKRIDALDLIDFYSSGKVKKNIQAISPKVKYAKGGALPSLSYNYDFNDRLIESFERYANRPSVVSVVDIQRKMDDVNNVKAMAGLSN